MQEFRRLQQDRSDLIIQRPKKPRHNLLSTQELRVLPAVSAHADEGTHLLRELFGSLLEAGWQLQEGGEKQPDRHGGGDSTGMCKLAFLSAPMFWSALFFSGQTFL